MTTQGSGRGLEFDVASEVYDGYFPRHVTEHYVRRRVEWVCRHAGKGRLLDVGCGTGRLAEALAGNSRFWVVGADASGGMLGKARERNVRAVRADSPSLPFRTGSFDATLSVAMLHHVAADGVPPDSVLREMVRVTRRNGWVMVIDHNPLNPYWPVLLRRVPWDRGVRRLIPPQEVLSCFQGAGVDGVKMVRSGFIPDFVPEALAPVFSMVERCLERTPIVRRFLAHYMIVGRKADVEE